MDAEAERRDRALWTPFSANFTGLSLIPATALGTIVNVDDAVTILLRSKHYHQPPIIGTHRNPYSPIRRFQRDTRRRIIDLGQFLATDIILLQYRIAE